MDKCKNHSYFCFFVKVIAPQPSASMGKRKRNTEPTQPIDGEKNDGGTTASKIQSQTQPTDSENNEMSQVVEVITHENKEKMGQLLHKSSMKNSKINQKSMQYTLLYLQVDVHRVEKGKHN